MDALSSQTEPLERDVTRLLEQAKRIVVKIGSSIVIDDQNEANAPWLAGLASDIAQWRAKGRHVIVVSSGAVGLGRRALELHGRLKLEEKQAAAAVGQGQLMRAYDKALAPHGLRTAQLLLTIEDSEQRRRYLNARATLEALLELNVVPIINENDTVATNELRFGDNDRLAARAAQMSGADALILLSDIDGLYTEDPRNNPNARHLSFIDQITPEIEAMGGGPNAGPEVGTGGMKTKISAAQIALSSGCATVVAAGDSPTALSDLEAGARHTLFARRRTPGAARKAWIAGHLNPVGRLWVDAGARHAVESGKSLLPAGVTRVEGDFLRGDPIAIADPKGADFARGLVAYDAPQASLIAGRQSGEIESIIGYRGRSVIVHRNDLALLPTSCNSGRVEERKVT